MKIKKTRHSFNRTIKAIVKNKWPTHVYKMKVGVYRVLERFASALEKEIKRQPNTMHATVTVGNDIFSDPDNFYITLNCKLEGITSSLLRIHIDNKKVYPVSVNYKQIGSSHGGAVYVDNKALLIRALDLYLEDNLMPLLGKIQNGVLFS